MVSLMSLWLPILLAAVLVFVVSSIRTTISIGPAKVELGTWTVQGT